MFFCDVGFPCIIPGSTTQNVLLCVAALVRAFYSRAFKQRVVGDFGYQDQTTVIEHCVKRQKNLPRLLRLSMLNKFRQEELR